MMEGAQPYIEGLKTFCEISGLETKKGADFVDKIKIVN